MTIAILGASFAGVSAALKAAQLYPEKRVVLIDKEEQLAIISKSLDWLFEARGRLCPHYPFFDEDLLKKSKIDLLLGAEVKEVIAGKKLVYSYKGSDQTMSFDRVIIATGSIQESTYITGSDLEGVLLCKTVQDDFRTNPLFKRAKRVAVIGGGQVGMTVAEACYSLGKEVSLFEAMDSLDPRHFDGDFHQPLLEAYQQSGIVVHLQERVRNIQPSENGLHLQSKTKSWAVDCVIVCACLRPNTRFLEQIGCLDVDGTCMVDTYLESIQEGIFVAGDALQLSYMTAEDKRHLPLINTAIRTGEIAAYNLYKKRFQMPPSMKLVAAQHFGWYKSAIGMTAEEASLTRSVMVSDYIWKSQVYIRVVVDQSSQQLLGVQVISQKDSLTLLESLVYPMTEGKGIADFVFQDFLYTLGEGELSYHLHQALLQSLDGRGYQWN